jgi:protein-tyrosine phosphatase
MKILMVCIGNICRSPMAEGIMRNKIKQQGLDWTVASAGIVGNPGQSPHKFSQQVCFVRGINLAGQGARRFKPEMLDQYDLIYAMSDDVLEEIRRIGADNPNVSKAMLILDEQDPGGNNSVPDPLNGPEQWFKIVYEMLDPACDFIIEKYKNKQ